MIKDFEAYWTRIEDKYKEKPAALRRIEKGRTLLYNHLQDPQAGLITLVTATNGAYFRVKPSVNARATARYIVDAGGCDCPDWPHQVNGNGLGRCKHEVAARTLAYHLEIPIAYHPANAPQESEVQP